jgi:hypothetical protein
MTTTSEALAIDQAFDKLIRSTIEQFNELLERNSNIWMPDQYPHQFVSIIENEVIPALESIEDYDPTPDTPYDFFHQ